MREIKFRAWDKKYNMMIQAESFQRDQMWISGIGEVFEIGEWSDYGGGGKTEDDCSDQYILMQFTGLKDRNGRKIYEGDVLRLVLVDYAHVPEQIFVVSSDSFFEDVCYLQNISRFVEDSDSETDGIEVIGNIYESPELPKGEESE